MAINKTVVIPIKGHLLREESIILPEYTAFESVNRGDRYTAAKRDVNTDGIRLTRHWYECAECFQPFSAAVFLEEHDDEETDKYNTEYIDYIDKSESEPLLPERDFCGWALQQTFPESETVKDDFIFFLLPERNKALICPHCGYATHTTTRSSTYQVRSNPRLTMVTQIIEYKDKGFALPYEKQLLYHNFFPLTAKIIFDHESKQAFFMLTDKQNKILEQASLDDKRELLRGYAIQLHINTDSPLSRALLKAFGQFYNGKIPFESKEITLDTLTFLNRFQGFPKEFYNAIPFSETGLRIDEGFIEAAAELKNYADVPELYKKTGLPEKKSVKRAVFENPALLFYADELASLPFQNSDVLLQILNSENIFVFLAKLHSLPGIAGFITALVEEKGEAGAWSAIKNQIYHLGEAAAFYLLSPPKYRKKILREKIRSSGRNFSGKANQPYNLPVITRPVLNLSDCSIDGYDFLLLKNTYEYRKAGTVLRNCLYDYRPYGGQVVVIKNGDTFVAAVEVIENMIEQAYLSGNTPIRSDKALYKAFKQWKKLKGLKLRGELPF